MKKNEKFRIVTAHELEEILDQAETEPWSDLALINYSTWNRGKNVLSDQLQNFRHIFILNLGMEDLHFRAIKLRKVESLALIGKITKADALAKLTNLTTLHLRFNSIGDAGADALAKLTNLTTLDLQNNSIGDAGAQGLAKLTNLTTLHLSSNSIGEAGAHALAKLTNLTTLGLSFNSIGDAGAQGLAKLTNLTTLHLVGNGIEDVGMQAIAKLENLTTLDLRKNRLTTLPKELGQLTRLTSLRIGSNQVSTLPLEVAQQSFFKNSDLLENPLVSPPLEIVEQGLNAIKAYFEEAGATQPLAEVKLILVGHGEAGKTSLVKQLLKETFDPEEDQTHGINVRNYPIAIQGGSVLARIWDFGGQEIMHATHRFFLSRRSIFVIVLDGRRDENPDYWLNHASTYSNDAPILVVLNKIDQNPGYQINTRQFQEKFPKICGFYNTSCKWGKGIQELEEAITAQVARVPMIHTQWPETWIAVKKAMEVSPSPFLSRDEFSSMCQEAGVCHSGQEEVLVRFLNDLGIAIHFDQLNLDETHVLNPEWATNGVYRILTHPDAAEAEGLVSTSRKNLTRLLEVPAHKDQKQGPCSQFKYPRDKHSFIVELMEKFQLCYSLKKQKKILIPSLLPKNEPDFEFDYKNALKFRSAYPGFLPPTVMPRMIVLRYPDIEGKLRWRTGMVLKAKASEARAIIKADSSRNELLIWIEGSNRRNYLAAIRETMAQIHEDFPNLAVKQDIGCPCDTCKGLKTPFFFDYNVVMALYLKGIGEIACHFAAVLVPLPKILDGLFEGQTQALKEILLAVKTLQHETDNKGSQWDRIKKMIIARPGFWGFKLDLIEIFENLLSKSDRLR